jgi:hypothetical protein
MKDWIGYWMDEGLEIGWTLIMKIEYEARKRARIIISNDQESIKANIRFFLNRLLCDSRSRDKKIKNKNKQQ